MVGKSLVRGGLSIADGSINLFSKGASSSTGLVISLGKYFNGVRVDPDEKLIYAGGGAIWETGTVAPHDFIMTGVLMRASFKWTKKR